MTEHFGTHACTVSVDRQGRPRGEHQARQAFRTELPAELHGWIRAPLDVEPQLDTIQGTAHARDSYRHNDHVVTASMPLLFDPTAHV